MVSSQKETHREAKRIGSIALVKTRAGKLNPCNLFDAKQYPRPLEKGFPNDNTGETRLRHALEHGWIGRDFTPAITPDPSCPTF